MEQEYYIYLTERQGWVAPSGTSTDIKQATRFSRKTAIELSHKRFSEAGVGALPVLCDDMQEVMKK